MMLSQNAFRERLLKIMDRKHHWAWPGFSGARKDFARINVLPASRHFRRWLDTVSFKQDWIVGAAVLTIFVEGSVKDREEILKPSPPKSKAEIEDIVSNHPLVRHHGLSPGCLNLVRAHQMVES